MQAMIIGYSQISQNDRSEWEAQLAGASVGHGETRNLSPKAKSRK